MASKGQVVVNIIGDVSDLQAKLKAGTGELDKFGGHVQSSGDRLASVGNKLTVGLTGPLVAGLGLATKAAAEEGQEMALLANTMQNTIGATDSQVAATEEWITAQQNATGVSDGELRPALAKLLIAGRDLEQAQGDLGVAMDIAAARGVSLETVTNAMAKAAQGSTGALGKLGIQTKDAAGATLSFDEILANASKTMGGSAAAAADTAAGKAAIFQAKMADLTEDIGTKVLPAAEGLVDVLGKGADAFGALPPAVQTGVIALGGVAAAAGPIMTVVGNVEKLTKKVGDLVPSLQKVPWGAVGVGAAGAAGMLALYVQKQEEAEAEVREFTDALEADSGALGENTQALMMNRLERAGVVDDLAAAGVTMSDLSEAVAANGEAYANSTELLALMNNVGGEATEQSDRLAAKLREEGGARNDLLLRLYEQGELTPMLTSQIRKLFEISDASMKLEQDRSVVTGESAQATQKSAEALADEAVAAEEAQEALSGLLDAQNALFDSSISYEQQVNNVEDALTEYHEKVAAVMVTKGQDAAANEELERTHLDAASAILNLGQRAVDAAEHQATLEGKTLTAADAARIEREELQKVADNLAPGDPLRTRLEQYITQLDKTEGTRTATLALEADEAVADLKRAVEIYDRLKNKSISVEVILSEINRDQARASNQAAQAGEKVGREFTKGAKRALDAGHKDVQASLDAVTLAFEDAARRGAEVTREEEAEILGALASIRSAQEALNTAREEAQTPIEELRRLELELGLAQHDYNETVRESTSATDELAAAHQRLNDAISIATGGLGAIGGRADAQEGLQEARSNRDSLLREQAGLPARIAAATATRNRIAADLRAARTSEDRAKQEERLAWAQERLTELIDRRTQIVGLLRDAEEELTDAQIRAVNAQQSLIEAGESLIGTTPAMQQHFEQIAAAAGLSRAEIQGLVDDLRDLNREINRTTTPARGTKPGKGKSLRELEFLAGAR